MTASTPPATPAGRLADLAERFHRLQMAADPFSATYHGLPEHRDRLPDLSVRTEAQHRRALAALQADVGRIDPAHLDRATDEISRRMLLEALDHEIGWIDAHVVEVAVDAFALGPVSQLLFFLPRTEVADEVAATQHLARLAGIPAYLEQAADRHRAGIAAGRTPVQRAVAAAAALARRAAAQDPEDALLLAPLADQPDAIREAGRRTLRDVVAPALSAHADVLDADIAPHARPDDRPGQSWLPDGEDRYRAMLRRFTTLADADPETIHETGLAVLEQLAEEYTDVGQRVLGTGDIAEIGRRLAADPALRYTDPAEAVGHAQQVCNRAAEVVGRVIGRLPSVPCLVKAIPEVEAEGSAAAFYQVPAPDRPHGTYWINTTDPVLPRHEAEVTAFHEAWPGHHTQLAIQQELDLPAFRRIGEILSGYAEGWGLYCERLADELGLYSSDLDRLGMLAMDSLRACRLVIDTGIHHRGWSRQQGIDFMTAHAPVALDLAVAEVDRYIVLPGQACAYMLGRLEIQRLRADAERRLGARFDLAAFHDVVLGEGSVPLAVLAEMVERWVAEQAG